MMEHPQINIFVFAIEQSWVFHRAIILIFHDKSISRLLNDKELLGSGGLTT